MSLTDTEPMVKLPIGGAEGLLATLKTNNDLFTGYYIQGRLRSRCTRDRLVVVGAVHEVRAMFGLLRIREMIWCCLIGRGSTHTSSVDNIIIIFTHSFIRTCLWKCFGRRYRILKGTSVIL